jgi:hypothetical protein
LNHITPYGANGTVKANKAVATGVRVNQDNLRVAADVRAGASGEEDVYGVDDGGAAITEWHFVEVLRFASAKQADAAHASDAYCGACERLLSAQLALVVEVQVAMPQWLRWLREPIRGFNTFDAWLAHMLDQLDRFLEAGNVSAVNVSVEAVMAEEVAAAAKAVAAAEAAAAAEAEAAAADAAAESKLELDPESMTRLFRALGNTASGRAGTNGQQERNSTMSFRISLGHSRQKEGAAGEAGAAGAAGEEDLQAGVSGLGHAGEGGAGVQQPLSIRKIRDKIRDKLWQLLMQADHGLRTRGWDLQMQQRLKRIRWIAKSIAEATQPGSERSGGVGLPVMRAKVIEIIEDRELETNLHGEHISVRTRPMPPLATAAGGGTGGVGVGTSAAGTGGGPKATHSLPRWHEALRAAVRNGVAVVELSQHANLHTYALGIANGSSKHVPLYGGQVVCASTIRSKL